MKWYQLHWYRSKWFLKRHRVTIILFVILTLWLVTLVFGAWRTIEINARYKEEAKTLSEYIAQQQINNHYNSMVLDSTYSKLEMIESEIISLAGEMNKIRKGR
jgi:cell division protein FtsB